MRGGCRVPPSHSKSRKPLAVLEAGGLACDQKLIPVESEIMPGAGEIEAFVAQRKIGDAVFTYGEGETLPVVK
jgi:hypothetical protein